MFVINGDRLECFEVLIVLVFRMLFIFLCVKKDVFFVFRVICRGVSDYVDKSLFNWDLFECVISYNLVSKCVKNILWVLIFGIKVIGEVCL